MSYGQLLGLSCTTQDRAKRDGLSTVLRSDQLGPFLLASSDDAWAAGGGATSVQKRTGRPVFMAPNFTARCACLHCTLYGQCPDDYFCRSAARRPPPRVVQQHIRQAASDEPLHA